MSPSPFADLPILDDIQVASPCTANWEEMVGDQRRRFCSQCKKHVFNLSAMSRGEAEDLLQKRRGLCVRFYRRADGTVLTQDCPVGLALIRRRAWRAVTLAWATALSLMTSAGLGWSHWKPKSAAKVEPNSLPLQVAPVSAPACQPMGEPFMGDVAFPPATTGRYHLGGAPAPR